MTFVYLVLFFIFSLIIGSFLNVVIYRYNSGLSIAKGRSKCFSCGRVLGMRDLVPVFSFIAYKGRCRTCKTTLSIQYPLIEILTGVLLTAVFYKYFLAVNHTSFIGVYIVSKLAISQVLALSPWIQVLFFVIDIVMVSLLICIGVYDMKHKIIPDGLVYSGAGLALVKLVLVLSLFTVSSGFVTTLLAGLLTALPFALLWLVSGGRWMGFGDAKLALIIGWMLGVVHGFTAIVYSFWIGCIGALGMILIHELVESFSNSKNVFGKRLFGAKVANRLLRYFPTLKLRSEVPFGPYMIIAFLVVYFTGQKLLGL